MVWIRDIVDLESVNRETAWEFIIKVLQKAGIPARVESLEHFTNSTHSSMRWVLCSCLRLAISFAKHFRIRQDWLPSCLTRDKTSKEKSNIYHTHEEQSFDLDHDTTQPRLMHTEQRTCNQWTTSWSPIRMKNLTATQPHQQICTQGYESIVNLDKEIAWARALNTSEWTCN